MEKYSGIEKLALVEEEKAAKIIEEYLKEFKISHETMPTDKGTLLLFDPPLSERTQSYIARELRQARVNHFVDIQKDGSQLHITFYDE